MDLWAIYQKCWVRANASLYYYDTLQDRYDAKQMWLDGLTTVVVSGLSVELLLEACSLLPILTLLLRFTWSAFGLGLVIMNMQLAPGRRAERCQVLSNHWRRRFEFWDRLDLSTTSIEILQQAQKEDWDYDNPRISTNDKLLKRSTVEATHRFECGSSNGHTPSSSAASASASASSAEEVSP
jgi:hypothetical protein